jgi:hypothetical protein
LSCAAAVRALEIERATLLVAIDRQVIRTLACDERGTERTALVARTRLLDLDDLGAEIAEEHRAERA